MTGAQGHGSRAGRMPAIVVVGGSPRYGFGPRPRLLRGGRLPGVAVIGRTEAALSRARVADLSGRGKSGRSGPGRRHRGTQKQVDKAFADLGERWGGELNVLINTVGPGGGWRPSKTSPTNSGCNPSRTAWLGMVRCVRFGTSAAAPRRNGRGSSIFRRTRRNDKRRHAAPPTPRLSRC